MPVIALIDGEHHPPAVREVLDAVDEERGLAAVVFCGGSEKLRPGVLEDPAAHYGRPVLAEPDPAAGLRAAAAAGGATAVLDLADAPALSPAARLDLAAVALHLGLAYEGLGLSLAPPHAEALGASCPVLAVIGTGKRTGKTAVAGHWAALLRREEPVIVCMGRGGPAEPVVTEPGGGVEALLELSDAGDHAASDHLEGAELAGVRTIGCRRVGGGPAGEPASSNVVEGARIAAALEPGAIILEGSGSAIPPVTADRTVCVVGGPVSGLERTRTLRADLCLLMAEADVEGPTLRCALRPEPAGPIPPDARVALFTTGAERCDGVEPVLTSTSLARRAELSRDLDRAAAEGCDVFLTELKAAAIDTVAARARTAGVRVVFVRNRPVGLDGDLDAALLTLYANA